LEKQITIEQIELQAHEAELRAAHPTHVHLLPRELPQMKPFQTASRGSRHCRSGGDYFDVLALGSGRPGICIGCLRQRNHNATADDKPASRGEGAGIGKQWAGKRCSN
jgi:hypothetical protein